MFQQRYRAAATLALMAAMFTGAARADDLHWTGAAGDNLYNTPGNWNLGRAPTLGDNVYIFAPASTTITCNSAIAEYLISTATLFVNTLTVRGNADVFGDVVMNPVGVPRLSLGGEFKSNGFMVWTNGSVTSYNPLSPGQLTVTSTGQLQIGTPFELTLGAHLYNQGHVSHTRGAIRLDPFATSTTSVVLTIGNAPAGNWESSGGTHIYSYDFTTPPRIGVVINYGGWSFLGGTGPAKIDGSTSFGNVGSVTVRDTEARIKTLNDVDTSTGQLVRGSWSMYGGGRLLTADRTITEIGADAFVYIQGAGSMWDSLNRTKSIRGTLMVDEGADVTLAPAFLDPFVNWGTLTVGAGAHLHVVGSYYQKPGALLRRIIDNTGDTPRVGVLDTDLSIALAGEVSFEPYDTTKIAAGEEFDLLGLAPLACCIVEGEFATVTTLVPGRVRYDERVATFVAGGCEVDLNGDGIVDFSDYLEFLNLFDAEDPRVDFNGDGLVDFSDYLEFLNLFDAGC